MNPGTFPDHARSETPDPHHHSHHATEHFDARAATWDDTPEHRERAAVVVAAITDHVTLRSTTSVLEVGAGTGLVAQGLQHRVGQLTLADTSAGMREVIAAKIASGALPANTQIWDVDPVTAPPTERFDLVVAAMVLHHMEDVAAAITALAAMVADSGTLCIADLDSEDGSYHSADVPVHHGFERAALAEQLRAAGLDHVSFVDGAPRERDGRVFSTFVAFARQGAASATR